MSRFRRYADTVARAFVTGPGAVPDQSLTSMLGGYADDERRVDYGEYIQTSNAVYTAARLRASLLSSLPIVAYRVGPDGRRDKVTAGPLVELLQKVNPFWTFQRLVEMTELSLCLWGSAYIFLDRGTNRRGRPMEMWWARPDRVTVVPDKENYVSHFLYQVGSDQPPIRFERDEVVWLRYPNPLDEFDGLSPLASAAIAADTSRAAMISNAAMFRNGLQMAGVVQPANGQNLTEEQARGLEQAMARRFKGADKAHRWGVLRFEAKFQPLSVTPKDAEFLGSLKWSLEEICRAYGVPLDLLGGERTYANQADARLAIWTDTILPEARFISTELTEQLLPLFAGVADVIEFDASGVAVLQEAEAAKWTIEKEQIATGALTVNEWRTSKGLDPLPWGEAWWAQATLVPVIDTGVGLPPVAEQPTPPPAPEPTPAAPRSVRAVADVDLRPTEEMAAVARRALAWKADGRPGGTAVGLARANQLAARENLSPETVGRMVSFFARHEVDKQAEGFDDGEDGFPSPGRVAWDLWGGDPGRAWAERKLAEIERERESGRTVPTPVREYGDAEHLARFDAYVRSIADDERKFGNAVADLMRRQRQAVLARVKSERSGRTIEDAAGNPFDLARWVREFRVVLRPIYREIVAAAGQRGIDAVGAGLSFDVLDPRVVRFMERQVQRFAEQVNQTTWDALRASLAESITEGEDVLKAADRVDAVMGDRIRSSAEAIARTEVGTAVNGGQVEGWRQSGTVGGKRWLSAIDDRTREAHVAAHDQAVAIDEPFVVDGEEGMYPGDFPSAANVVNCFPADTTVYAEDVHAATMRMYDGPMVVLTFDDGRTLAATPNHPVLTGRGFVPVRRIKNGDNLVGYRLHEHAIGTQPHPNYGPASFEEVFRLALIAGDSQRVDGSPMQFHGDGTDNDVNVVSSVGVLLNDANATVAQPRSENILADSDVHTSRLLGDGTGMEIAFAASHAANGIVGRSSESRTLFRSGARHSNEHRLTTASRIDAALKQSPTNNLAADAELIGDSLFRHAGEVTLNKVIDVEIVSFHGPVYNLHTARNFYAANGIIAHNCRCTMVPIVDTDWAEMQAGG